MRTNSELTSETIKALTKAPYAPSTYQEGIIRWAMGAESGSAALVDAVAGSGKSSTLKLLVNALNATRKDASETIALAAFNNRIVEELKKIIGETAKISTLHSFGRQALAARYRLGRATAKTYDLARDACDVNYLFKAISVEYAESREQAPDAVWRAWQAVVRETYDMARAWNLHPSDKTWKADVEGMVEHFGMDDCDDPRAQEIMILEVIPMMITRGLAMLERGIHDFTDMLYAPVRLNLKFQQFDWFCIDECQDLSPIQLEIVMRSIKPTGRLIFVGDPYQAINGFAGADCNSIDKIVSRTGAVRLPLSVCYRCPTSHVDIAREIVSHIESHPHAEEGEILNVKREELVGVVTDSDLILARTNAVLFTTFFFLFKQRVPVRIVGDNMSEVLCNAANRIMGKGKDWKHFDKHITNWCDSELARIPDNVRNKVRREKIEERAVCMLIVWEGANRPGDFASYKAAFNEIYADRKGVTLSSVHRAKGLEADRVFLLGGREAMQLKPRKGSAVVAWKQQQERHVHYVALTRAKKALYMVELPKPEAKPTIENIDPEVAPSE